MFETAAFEVRLELLPNVLRQWAAGRFARREKRRIVRLDEPIEQRLFGPVPRVAWRIDERRRAARILAAWRSRAVNENPANA